LTWSDGEHFYTHHDRIWVNTAVAGAIAWAPAGEEDRALSGLRNLGVTHLIVDRRQPGSPNSWDAFALTGLTARSSWYEELYADGWYVLYRVQWEAIEHES
jgi:hypothetical protein